MIRTPSPGMVAVLLVLNLAISGQSSGGIGCDPIFLQR